MDSVPSAPVSLVMSSNSEETPPAETSRLRRLREVLRFTPRSRRQLLRALIVTTIFVIYLAALATLFAITMLQYTLAGFRLTSIVIVAAIGLTVISGIGGFANFAYGAPMPLAAYLALSVVINRPHSLV